MYVLIYEALGTGLLITAINWSSDTGFGTFIIGLQLAANIVLLGPVSNSHCNPAVTLGVFIRECHEKRSDGFRGFNALYALCIMAA